MLLLSEIIWGLRWGGQAVTLYVCFDGLLNYYCTATCCECSWALGARWGTCIVDWGLDMLGHSQVNFDIELLRENFECCGPAAFILVHFPLECALFAPSFAKYTIICVCWNWQRVPEFTFRTSDLELLYLNVDIAVNITMCLFVLL
jgi:hypothetical protein